MDLEPYIENTANTPSQFGAYDVMHQVTNIINYTTKQCCGEDICQLIIRVNKIRSNVSRYNLFTNELSVHLRMIGSLKRQLCYHKREKSPNLE